MDLFSEQAINILPCDGIAIYHGHLFPPVKADQYLDALTNSIEWKNDEAFIMGKKIITKRKVAWYGEKPFAYTYSKSTKNALAFTKELLEIKAITEKFSGETYNSCLLNLYHNGSEGMGWHCDAEKELKKNAAIASLSFGAARKFIFKHKRSQQTVSLLLEHGSILLMKDEIQTHWLHRLPPTTRVLQPRINLTFRTIIE